MRRTWWPALVLLGLAPLFVSQTAVAGDPQANRQSERVQRAPTPPTIGLNTLQLWNDDPYTDLRPAADAGIRWIRVDFDWRHLSPKRGTYRWEPADRLMAAAARLNMRVLAIADYSAPWASSDPSGEGAVHFPPSSAKVYARYAKHIVARYGGSGSFWKANPQLPRLPLKAIEVWNEPFQFDFWKPRPDPTRYGRLVKSTSRMVRGVDPGVKVLAAGDYLQYDDRGQRPWLPALLASHPNIAKFIDAWSIHPYPDPVDTPPWQVPRLGPAYGSYSRIELTQEVSSHLRRQRPIWITEVGWCTSVQCGSLSDEDRARYATHLVRTTTQQFPSVRRVFFYTWNRVNGPDREGTYGLRLADGEPTRTWGAIETLLGHKS